MFRSTLNVASVREADTRHRTQEQAALNESAEPPILVVRGR